LKLSNQNYKFLGQKIGCPSYDLSHLNRLLLTQNYDLQTFKFHFVKIIRSCVAPSYNVCFHSNRNAFGAKLPGTTHLALMREPPTFVVRRVLENAMQ